MRKIIFLILNLLFLLPQHTVAVQTRFNELSNESILHIAGYAIDENPYRRFDAVKALCLVNRGCSSVFNNNNESDDQDPEEIVIECLSPITPRGVVNIHQGRIRRLFLLVRSGNVKSFNNMIDAYSNIDELKIVTNSEGQTLLDCAFFLGREQHAEILTQKYWSCSIKQFKQKFRSMVQTPAELREVQKYREATPYLCRVRGSKPCSELEEMCTRFRQGTRTMKNWHWRKLRYICVKSEARLRDIPEEVEHFYQDGLRLIERGAYVNDSSSIFVPIVLISCLSIKNKLNKLRILINDYNLDPKILLNQLQPIVQNLPAQIVVYLQKQADS